MPSRKNHMAIQTGAASQRTGRSFRYLRDRSPLKQNKLSGLPDSRHLHYVWKIIWGNCSPWNRSNTLKLTLPATHGNNLDQWTFTKSLILLTVSSIELAADQDFQTLATSICENQRSIITNQLRDVASEETVLYTSNKNPLITVGAGEVVYMI